jgi:hypothetical protein
MSIPRNLSFLAENASSTGVLSIAGGGTNTTSFSANQIHYGLFSQSAGLTFDGTNFATTGTATAAKLIPTGTSVTGNGMYLPATNALGFSTNGTNAVYIDASQNVGVGTSSLASGVKTIIQGAQTGGAPQTSGTTQTYGLLRLQGTSFTSVLDFGTNGGNYNWIQATDNASLATNYTLVLNPNGGNVGIGTTSPTVYSGYTTLEVGSTAGLFSAKHANGNAIMYNYLGNAVFGSTSNYATIFNSYSVERMRIDSSGNVMIGTSSTAYKFEVQGSANTYFGQRIYNTNAGSSAVSYLQIGNDTNGATAQLGLNSSTNTTNFGGANGLYLSNGLSAPIAFATAGSERMRIDSSGNVGIGTSSPALKLDVTGAASTNGSSRSLMGITDTTAFATGVGGGITFRAKYNTAGSYIDAGNIKGIKENATDGNAASALVFSTQANGGSPTEQMRIDSSGNVGVGTSSPSQKLSVIGNIAAGDTASTADGFVDIAGASTGSVRITRTGTSATNSSMVFSTTYSTLQERMRIDGLGNVGIGTSSPGTKLDVNGVIRSTGTGAILAFSKRSTGTGDAWGMYSQSGEYNIYDYTAAASRLVIDTSGNLLVGGATATNIRLVARAIDSSASYYCLYLENSSLTSLFYVRNDGYTNTGLAAASPYNATIGLAANLHVYSGDGGLYRATSSIKYKRDVVNYTKGLDAVATLRPVFYKGTNPVEGDTVYAGLIAEEVHTAGLTEFVQYNQEHEPEGLAYGNMAALLIKAIQEQQALITSLTARITALESKG